MLYFNHSMLKRLIASLLSLTFSFSGLQLSQAQDGFNVNLLPMPGTMVAVSMPFIPFSLKGLVVSQEVLLNMSLQL